MGRISFHYCLWTIKCQGSEKYLSLKSSGVFTDQELLYKQFSKDVNHFYTTHSITISFFTEKSLRDLTKEMGEVFWFKLCTAALIQMPSSNDAKKIL